MASPGGNMESPVYSAQQINGAPLRSGLRQIASQLRHASNVVVNVGCDHKLKGGIYANVLG